MQSRSNCTEFKVNIAFMIVLHILPVKFCDLRHQFHALRLGLFLYDFAKAKISYLHHATWNEEDIFEL